jgi:raffinose/stachyose/melibiose transport system substrate-binding protein
MLAKAKQDGDIPIAFGNLDKYGGIHEYQTVQNQFADKQATRDFVFARDGASFATSENEEAAKKLQEWASKGYFTPDYNGTGYDPAWQQFAKGAGPFLIGGTWLTSDLADAMGDKVGFFLMPGPEEGREPVSLGGESLPWGITQKSKNADVAAAYIDFLTNPEAAQVLVETNNLPAMKTDAQPTGGVSREVSEAWRALNDADGLTPYIDYATPTFYDDFSGGVQRLLPGRLSPKEFVDDMQDKYAKFTGTL